MQKQNVEQRGKALRTHHVLRTESLYHLIWPAPGAKNADTGQPPTECRIFQRRKRKSTAAGQNLLKDAIKVDLKPLSVKDL